MGDIFFLIRMIIFTFLFVAFMQIKVGSTTIEEKVTDLTHRSEVAQILQEVADGATRFIGNQYNRITRDMNSEFIENHALAKRPGSRLKAKMSELKEDIENQWNDYDKKKLLEALPPPENEATKSL